MFDGDRSEDVKVIPFVPQGSVLGSLLYLLYTSDLPTNLENALMGFADYSTLLDEALKPRSRVPTASFLNSDLARISDWCEQWAMLVNPNKAKALVIYR